MHLAVHYSVEAADLRGRGEIAFDYFKCPAWPELADRVWRLHPTYVHFGLAAGKGSGTAFDWDTKGPADWGRIESLLAMTGTPYVNVHLAPLVADYPDVAEDSERPVDVERVTEALIRDVRGMVRRFGAGRVVAENERDAPGRRLRLSCRPDVIRAVIEETGCGLLLDVSHARLAARYLEMDAWDYLAGLPLARTREVHVTGIQRVDEVWVEYLRQKGLDARLLVPYVGRLMDHLPLAEADWTFAARAFEEVRRGAWGEPWMIALEYGGIGPIWEQITDANVLRAQVPRLFEMVKAIASHP